MSLTLDVVFITSPHPGHGDVIVAMDAVNALLPLLSERMLVRASRGELVVVVDVVVVVAVVTGDEQQYVDHKQAALMTVIDEHDSYYYFISLTSVVK